MSPDNVTDTAPVESNEFDTLHAQITAAARKDYKFLDLQALFSQPEPTWLVEDVLPRQGIAAIYGPSGSGKTFLALDLALSVATCPDWFGRRIEPATAFYCPLEASGGVGRRLKAWTLTNSGRMNGDRLAEAFKVLDSEPFSLTSADHVQALGNAINANQAEAPLVILDTLACAMAGADENSAQDMGQAIEGAKALQRLTGGLVVLVHHTGKDQTKGMRGSSALYAALDAVIECRDTANGRDWRLAKSKDSETGIAAPFSLQEVDLTQGAGKHASSCAVTMTGTPQSPAPAARKPSGENQRIALEVATAALAAGRPTQKDLLDLIGRGLVQQAGIEARRKASRAKEAFEGLVKAGFIETAGETYRVTERK